MYQFRHETLLLDSVDELAEVDRFSGRGYAPPPAARSRLDSDSSSTERGE